MWMWFIKLWKIVFISRISQNWIYLFHFVWVCVFGVWPTCIHTTLKHISWKMEKKKRWYTIALEVKFPFTRERKRKKKKSKTKISNGICAVCMSNLDIFFFFFGPHKETNTKLLSQIGHACCLHASHSLTLTLHNSKLGYALSVHCILTSSSDAQVHFAIYTILYHCIIIIFCSFFNEKKKKIMKMKTRRKL